MERRVYIMYGSYNDYMQMQYPAMTGYEPIRYPEIYYTVYPVILRKCEMMDSPHNPIMWPYPSHEMVEKMTDEIYNDCKLRHADLFKKCQIDSETEAESETAQFWGPGGLLRGLIGVLLIRELLRRRRYSHGYRYGPGYGYY